MEIDRMIGENKEYTIKLIPQDGGTVHSVKLPASLLKYGLASLGVGAMLLVGAFSYAVYSMFHAQSDASEMEELRQVNSIQQEQLLQLAKKANALQDQMEQLKQTEDEIRRMSGASPAADLMQAPESQLPDGESGAKDGAGQTAAHDGQGGPYVAPDVYNVSQVLDMVEKGLAMRRASLEQLRAELKNQREQMVPLFGQYAGIPGLSGNMPSIWPANGEVSSPYGLRWGGTDFHPGMDIANDMGTPIVATADGMVTVAGWNSGGYGNMVDIDHGNGIMTRYGHGSQVVVSAGQYVRKGQLIMYMGSTGFSTGPHVHYEVHVDGQTVNPVSYLW